MSINNNLDIEGLFKRAFQEERVTPDAGVVRSLRFKLWKAEFFSLDFRKFNIFYATILLGVATFIPVRLAMLDEAPKVQESSEANLKPESHNSEKQPVSASISEEVKEDVSINAPKEVSAAFARFEPSEVRGCSPLIVKFRDMSVSAKAYKWDFGDGEVSRKKEPVHRYTKPGKYAAKLIVAGSDGNEYSYTKEIEVFEAPSADFDVNIEKSDVELKKVVFENRSEGAGSYLWDFGDNTTTSLSHKQIEHSYGAYKAYKVTLITTSEKGCRDTVVKTNSFIEKDYHLSFPLRFSPNIHGASNKGYVGSAGNSAFIFHPANNGVKEYKLTVFAPNGTEVFSTTDIKQGWNGFYKGRLMPSGTYAYQAKGVYPNGKEFEISSNVNVVVRNYNENY